MTFFNPIKNIAVAMSTAALAGRAVHVNSGKPLPRSIDTGRSYGAGLNRRFKDYLLENVYLATTEAHRGEILALWRNGGATLEAEPEEADRRSRETVFMVRASTGELAGVSGVALVRVKGRRRFYAYSTYLRGQDRVPYLMLAVLNATRDFLRGFQHPKSKPEGMLLVTENHKLMRPGVRKLLVRHRYQYWGRNAKGEDVWAVEFAESDNPAAGSSRPADVSVHQKEALPLPTCPLATTTCGDKVFRLSTAKSTKTKERNTNEYNRSSQSVER
jgi:hypothetical protein